jgi:phosphoglycerol transferase MdoB-like AlkP superfamily enzyme
LYGPWLSFALTIWLKHLLFHSAVQIWPEGRTLVLPPLGTLGHILVLHGLLLLVGVRARFAGALALSTLTSAVLLADTLYFRFAGDILSTLTATSVGDRHFAFQGALALLRPADAAYALDLVIGLVLLPWYLKRVADLEEPRLVRRIAASALMVCGIAIVARSVERVLSNPESWLANGYMGELSDSLGVLNAHIFEYGRHVYHHGWLRRRVTSGQRQEVRDVLGRRRPMTGPSHGVARGRNVLVVMVESLEALPLGLRVQGAEVTPRLNALRNTSLELVRFYDQTWQGWTSDGWLGSMQGLHPLPLGSAATVFPNNHFFGLPAVLRESGYDTFSAHAYNNEMWNMGRTHAALGFARSSFAESFTADELLGGSLGDRSFIRQVLPQVTRLSRPFLAFLVTTSSHFPYELLDGDRRLDLGSIGGTPFGKYLQAVHYVDAAIGELIDGLHDAGLWNDTILVIHGDHRASLGNGDEDIELARKLGVALPANPTLARWYLHHRLACLIHLPGDALAGPRLVAAGQLDVSPTLLGLLGSDTSNFVTFGRDVLSEDGLVVFRDGGFARGDIVCLTSAAGSPIPRCFNVNTSADVSPEDLGTEFEEARAHLAASDMTLYGDLIPELRSRRTPE